MYIVNIEKERNTLTGVQMSTDNLEGKSRSQTKAHEVELSPK